MRRLVTGLILLALSVPAVAAAGPEPAPSLFRVALGETTLRAAPSGEVRTWIGAQLAGVERCADSMKAWQAANPSGWVASFRVSSTETGALHEFHWNTNHRLPPKVRKCIGDRVREAQFPDFSEHGRGYFIFQQVLFVLPRVPDEGPKGPLDAPGYERVPHDQVERAAAEFLWDIDDCMVQPDRGISLGIDQGYRGRVLVMATVGADGLVDSVAVAGVDPGWLQTANCVADWFTKFEFDRLDDEAALRLLRVEVLQVNFRQSGRQKMERAHTIEQKERVRKPVLSP